MTFKKWIKHFKDVDLPLGDLARDIISDSEFPNSSEYKVNRNYLESKTNWDAVLETFDKAWNLYK